MRTWLVPLFIASFLGLISTQWHLEDVELDEGYGLKAPDHVLVEEGLCALIPCNFTYNKGHAKPDEELKGFWKKGTVDNSEAKEVTNSAGNRFQLIGNLTAGNCSLLIWNAQKLDAGKYFFRMEKLPDAKYSFFSFANPSLKVTERQLPEIKVLDTMSAGCSTNITCLTFASCSWMPLNFTWGGLPKRINRHLHQNGTHVYSSVVNFLPSAADHKRNITCRVDYLNETNSAPRDATVQLNVTFIPQMLGIKGERFRSNKSQENFTSNSQLKVPKGDCIRLRCKTKGNPSPNVTWVKGTKVFERLQAWNVLKLCDLKLEDAGNYTCRAANEIGFNETSVELFIIEPDKTLLLAVTGVLVILVVSVLIIGIIIAFKKCRRKTKPAMDSSYTGNTLKNVKKPNTSDLAVQEMNGIPSKPRSTHESVDEDPRDPEEIHYAALTFNAPNPKPDITAEEVSTDYAEISPCSSQKKEAQRLSGNSSVLD